MDPRNRSFTGDVQNTIHPVKYFNIYCFTYYLDNKNYFAYSIEGMVYCI
jgi:hypothetical protein